MSKHRTSARILERMWENDCRVAQNVTHAPWQCKSIDMWCPAHKCTKAPWRIGGQVSCPRARWLAASVHPQCVGSHALLPDMGRACPAA
eukprot:1479018-Rhodomonas_salina.3